MIIRIVKMTFHEDNVEDFKSFTTAIRPKILAQKGCRRLDILQDVQARNIFFTYSHWDSEEDLDRYRNSDFFNNVWPKAKQWFSKKPKAWSTKAL
ncbi:MAG: antibiotic biosynthesis monooxygenase [bacterium]|nr:antibiotic biosynthesis monooxygenase [bacterium]